MVVDFIAGCFGGCAGLVVGYPLDTIKVHIQTQNNKNPQYRGTWHCFQSILAKESVAGFYKGITSPLAGVAVINAIVFGVYGQAQKNFIQNSDELSMHFLAGAAAGLAQSPVASPLELAKTRLQLQTSTKSNLSHFRVLPTHGKTDHYTSPLQCLCEIYRKRGIPGVFSGLSVTALREVPSYGLYFSTYEALIRISDKSSPSTLHMLIAGGIAGIVSWVFTYPVDVIKSRLQADNQGRYTGAVDCFRKSFRDEGFKCLFRGLNSTIIRAFPTNAITFTVVHWTYRLYSDTGGQIKMQNKLINDELSSDSQLNFKLYNYNYNNNLYNLNNSDNNNNNNNHNRNKNSNHNHYHHCNVLFHNFNSLFNSIIDNANTFNLYCQATTASHKNEYKNSK